MIFGSATFATTPFMSVFTDASEPSQFSALLQNQDADRAYLLHAQPYDPDSAQQVDVRFSVGLDRVRLDGKAWPARLTTVLNSEVNLFSEDIGRGGSSTFGVIKIAIGDAEHDEILDYAWDGRPVTLLMGAPEFTYPQFQPMFVGTAQDIEFNEQELSIVIRDKAELVAVDVQENLYAGTGGLEGGSDLQGEYKPLCFGEVANIEPILVDRANLVYQVHDGSIEAVDGVFDGANALTGAGDVADITATSVSAGQYKTQLSGGYIKLGAEPTRALTADVRGDNSGSGYVDSAAHIVDRVVQNHTPLTADDIDGQSVSSVHTANSATTGWYGQHATASDIMTALMQSIGGSWVFNREGLLVLGVFQFSSPAGTVKAEDMVSLKRRRSPIPTWRRQIGYARSWVVQGQADVASAATDARKDFVGREFRYATDEDAAIKTRRTLSSSVTTGTLLADEADASSEATRQQGIFGVDRAVYQVVTTRQQFKYSVGQTITMNYWRFGFHRSVIVLGVAENTRKRQTTFTVFG